MDSTKTLKVSVVIKKVTDRQDKELADSNGDAYAALDQFKKLFGVVVRDKDEEKKDTILNLLAAARLSNEVMANAFIDIDRIDLFDEKANTVKAIDGIINQINNNI